MPIRYELKDHIQPVENAPIAEGILDQREITIQSYQTTVPFDLAKLNAGLETAWLSPTTRLGIFSEISTTGDDGYAAVLGMQDHLTVRAYDYDERRPLWYSWKDVIVETASIRYYRGNDGKLWFITMGGGRRITEDKLNEFNSIFLKIPPTSVTRQVFDLAKLRDLCFNRFVDRLFMVRFKDHSGKEYESIDRAQFQSNDFIDPKAARLHEVRIDNLVKIESFEAEIQVSSKELTTPAAVRFLVRGLSGALRLRFPRLDLRNASQKPDKQAEAFYRIVNETRDSILDVDYYESNQNEWKVLYEQQDLFPVTVDVTACRNMLTKPEARETFLTGLNACRPKHEWHPPLLALNEVVMKDSARKHVATLLADKAVEKPLEAARLLEECRVDPGLWRIGGIAATALSAKQHEIPAKERASAEGAILAWAVEREKDGWDVDNDTGEVTVLHWRGSLDNLAIGLRMRVVANLIDRVHAKLTNSDGNVGVLLKKFNWCVEAARGMPSQHSDCPSSLRLIVEGKVPKSLAEGIKVLKTPVGAVFFPNGEHYDFDPCFGDENRFYPDEFFKAGDYELRRVGKKNATLDALHADVREIKQIAIPLPGAIANVERGIESMMPHVRGIPKVLADLNEARLVPEEATRELFSQIQDVLTIEDQRIWTAVRNAGTQKGAIELLREADFIMSEATLSRRVRDIDEKLLKKGLPPCKASGPQIRFTKSGGHPDADGKSMPEDLSPVERDWANDQAERDITIQAYLNANPGDKEFFRQTKPGIEEEAQKNIKRRPMKSD